MNYFINHSGDKIELWSSERLKFEPKGWMREMRDTLKNHLKHSIKRNRNSCLYATYASKENVITNFDIENILFYNVGVDSFKNLANNGLIFERKIENPTELTLDSKLYRFDHYMNYKVLDSIIEDSNYWKRDKQLASWSGAKIEDLKTTLSLCSVWLQMSKCKKDVYNYYKNENPIGISINLKVPERYSGFNFVTILKSILDGIICSFHKHNGKDLDEITRRLCNKNYLNPENTRQLLMQNEKAILGQKILIRLWGDSVQWYPSDDLIYYGKIKIDYSNRVSVTEFDGELFTIKLAS